MKTINSEIRKEITIIEQNQLKPNFAYLGRKYGLDPRTIKRYFNGYEGKPAHRNKSSILDPLHEKIKEKLDLDGIKISSIYFYLKEQGLYQGSYSNLTYFIRTNFKDYRKNKNVHARYETEIGEQLQFDWVEDITLINKHGIEFNFNVFSAELSYSRMHYFCFSFHKTKEDVIYCLVKSFKFFGGVTESVLTDNMSSIVNTKELKFCNEFNAFAKDMQINLKKCKVRHPFTKGKVEVRNKFMKWLIPYNYEFETEQDIIEIIKKINIEVNNKINSTTNMKPILLYQKEKEYLKPLPANQILEHYMNLSTSVTVQNTSLVYYKGIEYSVPPKFINKTLKLKEIDNKLYIYNNTELITIHEISEKRINYKEEHYIGSLKESMPEKTDEFIEILAKKNLELFDSLTNLNKEKVGMKNEKI